MGRKENIREAAIIARVGKEGGERGTIPERPPCVSLSGRLRVQAPPLLHSDLSREHNNSCRHTCVNEQTRAFIVTDTVVFSQ